MGTREELLKECKELGITFVDDSFSISEIRQAIENKKKEIAKDKARGTSDDSWRKEVDPDQRVFVGMLESRGFDDGGIKKWLSLSASIKSQEELHQALNGDIRARNACRERHGLRKMQHLMPLREDIIDLYSHGLIDEWLNETDPENPEHRPNLPFEAYANEIIGELQKKEKEVQKVEALKAEIQTRFARLKVIPPKILTDPETGKVTANQKYNTWIDDANDLRSVLENNSKVYESEAKKGPEVPDLLKLIKSTHQLLMALIDKAKQQ
jgi:hypothetical protein